MVVEKILVQKAQIHRPGLINQIPVFGNFAYSDPIPGIGKYLVFEILLDPAFKIYFMYF